jgi:hypothetical protein
LVTGIGTVPGNNNVRMRGLMMFDVWILDDMADAATKKSQTTTTEGELRLF